MPTHSLPLRAHATVRIESHLSRLPTSRFGTHPARATTRDVPRRIQTPPLTTPVMPPLISATCPARPALRFDYPRRFRPARYRRTVPLQCCPCPAELTRHICPCTPRLDLPSQTLAEPTKRTCPCRHNLPARPRPRRLPWPSPIYADKPSRPFPVPYDKPAPTCPDDKPAPSRPSRTTIRTMPTPTRPSLPPPGDMPSHRVPRRHAQPRRSNPLDKSALPHHLPSLADGSCRS